MPVIHPAAKHIVIGYVKPDEIRGDLSRPPFMLLLHQNGADNLRRALRIAAFCYVLQRDALIVYVVDEQYRLPVERQMRGLQPFEIASMLGTPITTNLAIIHQEIAAEHPREPDHRDHAAHHDPDQNAVTFGYETLQFRRKTLICVLDFGFCGDNYGVRKGAQSSSTIQDQ